MRSLNACQHLLVVWVSVRAGAWLTVLWSANVGMAKESRGALVTALALCVMQAALREEDTRLVKTAVLRIKKSADTHVEFRTVQMPVSGWQESE